MYEAERQSSFFTTGGLAAVHVETRSKEGYGLVLKIKKPMQQVDHKSYYGLI